MAKDNNQLILLVVVLIAAGLYFGYIPVGGNAGQPAPQPQGNQPANQGLLTSNPSLDLTFVDGVTRTSTSEVTVRVLDSTGLLVSSGTTSSGSVQITSLSPNTNYILEVLNTSGTTPVYPFTTNVSTGAAGPSRHSFTYKSVTSAPTLTVYNNDDLTANSNSNAQSITTNESVTFRIRIRPASTTNDNNFFGDGVNPLNFAIDYNNLAIQSMSMKDGSTAMASGSGINGHSVEDVNKNATLYFETGPRSLAPSTNYDFYLTVKGSSAQEPVSVGTDDEIYVTVYDGCRVQNTQTGQYVKAYRDPVTNANICSTNGTSGIHYS